MTMTRQAWTCLLFDCDGVLVDSEPLTMGVLRDMLEELGWTMDLEECMRLFVGKATRDEAARIERETGKPFTVEWLHRFWARRDVALRAHLQPLAGAPELVHAARAALGRSMACVSGADRDKLRLQLEKTGMWAAFEGRVFSGHDFPRSKPHPDVYCAAMRALAVQPEQCVVIEDTATGVRAGVAAGAQVLGYCCEGNPVVTPELLRAAGAHRVVRDLAEVTCWVKRGLGPELPGS